jgi:dienelactone hydrolase
VIKLVVAAVLTVTPASTLVDANVDVRVTGLAPHAAVALRAATVDAQGRSWRSRVVYRADAKGVVDTHGSGRILWSMTTPAGHVPFDVQPAPTPVRITALVGARRVAAGVLTRSGVSAAVTEHDTTLEADGFLGKYFAPPPTMSPVARPVVLLLGGSDGGYADTQIAALYASHGYGTLALAYFGEPGLPERLQNIPLEYFEKALQWLHTKASRVLVQGASRGSEPALLIGATYPGLVQGVVGMSGFSSIHGGLPSGFGWTLGGRPVVGELPIERVHGPVLLLAGGEDAVIGKEAVVSAHRLQQRARQHGKTDVQVVVYPHAGHGVIGVPNLPAPGEAKGSAGITYVFGGEPTANALAHADSWAKIFRLLGTV